VESLIEAYQNQKDQFDKLKEDVVARDNRISELELQNQNIANELETSKGTAADRQQKLESAAQRVQEILKKLESVG
jgi:hypothetical protein